MSLGNVARNREPFVAPKLQITAMMDMFTIIVFFLLFSFADKPDEVELSAEIELPTSSTHRDYENTIKVFLSQNALSIEGEQVARIVDDKIIGYNANKPTESKLYKALEATRKKRLAQAETGAVNDSAEQVQSDQLAQEKNKPQILFFCDRAVPFKVMNTVMKTIGMVGYPNMQFAVMGER